MSAKFYFIFCSFLLLTGSPSMDAMSRADSSVSSSLLSERMGVRTLHYNDSKRNRPVAVELWYPTDLAEPIEENFDPIWLHPQEIRNSPISNALLKYPMIMMSHGHRGDRRDRSWLAEFLVRKGFIVASVEHYGNTRQGYNPLISLRFWERARDVTFAIDCLLAEPLIQDRIDPTQIGFVGYSLGGMTGLALGGAKAHNVKEIVLRQQEANKEVTPEIIGQVDFSEATCSFAETRIKAMVLICPAAFVYPPSTLQQVKIPVGLVAAINDEVLPHKEHAFQIIKHLVPAKLKVMRKEISHYTFLNRISESGKKLLHQAVRTDHPDCDRASIHKEVGVFTADFFAQQFKISK